jgi:cobalamin synthase
VLGRRVTDVLGMQLALLQRHSTPTRQTAKAEGTFARRSALAGGLAYTMLVVVMLVRAPELRMFAPIWILWALVVAGAIATYTAGNMLRRRTGGQSRRMRRRINTHRS